MFSAAVLWYIQPDYISTLFTLIYLLYEKNPLLLPAAHKLKIQAFFNTIKSTSIKLQQ